MSDQSTRDDAVALSLPGGTLELPIRPATAGASALDVGKLLPQTAIVDALRDRDPDGTQDAMRGHLHNVARSLPGRH
jgi:hypothetical protein